MCNKIKCAIQYTVDLINNNINRDVQEGCANRLYQVYTHSSNADDENSEYLLIIKLSHVNVIRPSLSLGAWWPDEFREEAPPQSLSFCHHAPEALARWQ